LSPALSTWIARVERVTAWWATAETMTRRSSSLARSTFHSININRTKEGIHEVIVYWKTRPDDRVVDALDACVKVQQGGQ
jgi:hypothetical protein